MNGLTKDIRLQNLKGLTDFQYKMMIAQMEREDREASRANKTKFALQIGKSAYDAYKSDKNLELAKLLRQTEDGTKVYEFSDEYLDLPFWSPKKLFAKPEDMVQHTADYTDMYEGVSVGDITVNPESANPTTVSSDPVGDTSSIVGETVSTGLDVIGTAATVAEIGSSDFKRQDQSYKDATGLQVGLKLASFVPGLQFLKPISALIGLAK